MSAPMLTRFHRDAGDAACARPSRPGTRILAVRFRSPDGRAWSAIGGGATVAAALADARRGLPAGSIWVAAGWNDLYGE